MDEISKVWPKWQPIEILGQGGFGTVYKCKRENMLDVSYSAIKVVKIPHDEAEIKEMTTSGMTKEHIQSYYKESVLSLLNEIKMMENLKSAGNIVGIEDYEVVENEDGIGWTVFIRMELLTNLSTFMEQYDFGYQEVLQMGIDICKALEVCHQQKIIHRDIKPGNIFVSRFGDFKLGDFGVSKEVEQMNATMSQKGTKSYMAPEMVKLEKTYDHTVDIYALGLTMYELLNHGRMPFLPSYPEPFFPKQREEAMLKRLNGSEFPNIDGLGELNDILKKACHFNPKQRYQSATEFKQALMNVEVKDVNFNEIKIDNHQTNNSNTQDDTMGITNNLNIFNQEKTDKTIGAFGLNTALFADVTIIKSEKAEIVNEPLTMKCPICGKNASLVFTHGYYCGKHVFTTSQDENVLKVKKLYESYLKGTNKKEYLKKMLNIDDSATLHCALGNVYIESAAKRYAKEAFKKAYELNPNHPVICRKYALVCLEEGKYSEGLEAIGKAEHHENELVALIKAILLQKLKRYDEALQTIVVAISKYKPYKFDWHMSTMSNVSTQASILDFLYEKQGVIEFEEMYYLHQTFRIVSFYGIGKKIYRQLFEKNRLKHNILKYGTNLPSYHALKFDEGMYKKNTFTKTYYFGCNGIYVFSTIATVGLTYISYFELATQCAVSINGNDLVIKKGKNEVKIPVSKAQQAWILDSIKDIIKANKKYLEVTCDGKY